MLLNAALTWPQNDRSLGKDHLKIWEPVGTATAKVLATEAKDRRIAALLWGVPAGKFAAILGGVQVFASSHPSGLSSSRPAGDAPPFKEAGTFAQVNEWFVLNGQPPIDWTMSGKIRPRD